MPQPSSIAIGEVFAGITVMSEHGRTKANKRTYVCQCHCGQQFIATAGNLKSGLTKSCGCINRRKCSERAAARNAKHGGVGTRIYRSWTAMKTRCDNPNTRDWPRYGGRGITYCDEWADFDVFRKDMGERPDGHSLDRFPNPDGDYEPGNCRWATPLQQAANKGSRSPSVSATPSKGQ